MSGTVLKQKCGPKNRSANTSKKARLPFCPGPAATSVDHWLWKPNFGTAQTEILSVLHCAAQVAASALVCCSSLPPLRLLLLQTVQIHSLLRSARLLSGHALIGSCQKNSSKIHEQIGFAESASLLWPMPPAAPSFSSSPTPVKKHPGTKTKLQHLPRLQQQYHRRRPHHGRHSQQHLLHLIEEGTRWALTQKNKRKEN